MSDTPARRGPGRPPLGPLADGETPVLVSSDVRELQGNLSIDGGDFAVHVPAEDLRGLLVPFNARARHVLVSLLRGYSRAQAATLVGIDSDTLAAWAKRHPEFGAAVRRAESWGFSRVFEGELYRRALAGPEDRGSMQALLAVAKARDSAYREKAQLHMDVVHRAQGAIGAAFGGWREGEAAEDENHAARD